MNEPTRQTAGLCCLLAIVVLLLSACGSDNDESVPFVGKFTGAYTGSEDGAFTGYIEESGHTTAQVVSPSVGPIEAVGNVSPSGNFSMEAEGQVMGSKFVITYTGQIADYPDGSFNGSGSWQSSSGYNGTWTLESD